ncbi:hypothetical protein SAMN05892883_0561 [Jatrophihabitans sp. GAS493]|uniref:hypothetical protein n=1 Tax=Jatrophihabitans sp. GAS493 TaxID=1907575 RepID=UPI000BBFCA96|nr:hypothetical protein [Jatrophihabitans sp. GAS493]SOD70940.1 hypothetical protein SAMN05892883_0561 [Jatrophihabitans sp. GAS493]
MAEDRGDGGGDGGDGGGDGGGVAEDRGDGGDGGGCGGGDGFGAMSRARAPVPIGPAADTSSRRRTLATVATRFSAMPPGVQVCSLGTCRAARGSARLGSSLGRSRPAVAGVSASVRASRSGSAASVGVHQRGGRTPASAKRRTGSSPGPASKRRSGTGRPVAVAKRVDARATLPIPDARSRPIGGPGRRSRCVSLSPNDAGSSAPLADPIPPDSASGDASVSSSLIRSPRAESGT